MSRRAPLLALAALLCAAVSAHAEEATVTLAAAPGHEVVETTCNTCHSLDYVRINAPFLDRKGWTAEVNKMINAFGAPAQPADAQAIIDYLARNYGTGG